MKRGKNMDEVILRNTLSEQYLCAAKKTFRTEDTLSFSDNKTVLVQISDLHGDLRSFQNALALIRHIKPTFAVHTGDVVTWNASDDSRFFYDGIENETVPIFNTIGNHDTFRNERTLSEKELYEMFVSPLSGIVCDEKPYYFVDFEKEALRLIVLCPYDFESADSSIRDKYAVKKEQADFLCRALSEAKEKGFGVLIAMHELADEPKLCDADNRFCQRFDPHPWGGRRAEHDPFVVEDIVEAFRRGEKIEKTYTYSRTGESFTVEHAFSGRGEFICYLTGHRHGDFCGTLAHHPGQLFFCMTCTGCFPEGYHNIGEEISDLPRIPDTVTEDALNAYVIDHEQKTVSVVRYGALINDRGEMRVFEKFRYETL